MGKKYGIKDSISMAAYKNSKVNTQAVKLRKSFEEVNKILNSRNTK